MLRLVAESGIPYVCMHWRGHAQDMQSKAVYHDVVSEVIAELRAQLDAAESAGVPAEKLIIDPGLGFAKTAEHNWQLLQRLTNTTGQVDYLDATGSDAAQHFYRAVSE